MCNFFVSCDEQEAPGNLSLLETLLNVNASSGVKVVEDIFQSIEKLTAGYEKI